MTPKEKIEKLKKWIRKNTPKDIPLLVPVSGGSDSAFCFWLCNQAIPKRVVGVFVGENLRSDKWFNGTGKIEKIKSPDKNTNQEVWRWARFLEISLEKRMLLIGTRNKTENIFGTYSLASRVASNFPLIGLWKTEIMELCNYAKIPDEIVKSSQRADPDCGRPKELAEIPLDKIDIFLMVKEKEISKSNLKKLTRNQLDYLEKIYKQNLFKKNLPVLGLKI